MGSEMCIRDSNNGSGGAFIVGSLCVAWKEKDEKRKVNNENCERILKLAILRKWTQFK